MYQEYLNQLHVSLAPMSTEDLKELLNDDGKLDNKTDEVLIVLKNKKDNLFRENRSKAELNLSKEPKIIELRAHVKELMEECNMRCGTVQEKMSQVKDSSGNESPDVALALLQTAAAKSEENSEELVEKFKENQINLETFLEDFLNTRKTMHLRKIKAEKMQEMLRQSKQRDNNTPAYGNLPANTGFYPQPHNPVPYNPGGVPYPISGPMMPMPPPRPY